MPANETLLYCAGAQVLQQPGKNGSKTSMTNVKNLHCLGDSSGWTRGLMMASVMGVLMGRELV